MAKNICVIGAGLAGGIVATKLAEMGHHVTLVEQGSDPVALDRETSNEIWDLDKPKAAFTRGKGIGGTSNFWHGGLTILDKTDVEGKSELFNEAKIPIKYTELLKYYENAINYIRGDKKFTLNDIKSTPDIKSNEFIINNEYYKYKGIIYPNEAFSTKSIIEYANKNYDLNVVNDYEINKINFLNDSQAVSIEGRDITKDEIKKIDADIFILTAGGLGSPKILLESAKNNIQLNKLPIGKYIIDHPTGFVIKAKLHRRMKLKSLFGQKAKGYKTQYGFTLKSDKLDIADKQNHILYLRPAVSMKDPLIYDFLKRKLVGYKGKNLQIKDIFYLIYHTDLLYEAINFKFGLFNSTRYVSGLVFLEQYPNKNDSITINNNGKYSIKWKTNEQDEKSLSKFLSDFFNNHSDIFESYKVFPGISTRLETAGHHSGGCRMSSKHENGVVDSNMKVFGTDNLYVVDGSVLGYSGHANTGLTISALALKCADDINRLL